MRSSFIRMFEFGMPFIIIALQGLTAAYECSRGVTYLDPVTGNCDPCSDICHQAKLQGTIVRCQTLCKGYGASRCVPGRYFNVEEGRCDPCGSICQYPKQRKDCQLQCPDWNRTVSPLSFTTQTEILMNPSTTKAANATQDNDGQDQVNKINIKELVLSLVVGTLAMILLVLLVWVSVNKIKGKMSTCANKCSKRGQLEQGNPMMSDPVIGCGHGPITCPENDENTALRETFV